MVCVLTDEGSSDDADRPSGQDVGDLFNRPTDQQLQVQHRGSQEGTRQTVGTEDGVHRQRLERSDAVLADLTQDRHDEPSCLPPLSWTALQPRSERSCK